MRARRELVAGALLTAGVAAAAWCDHQAHLVLSRGAPDALHPVVSRGATLQVMLGSLAASSGALLALMVLGQPCVSHLSPPAARPATLLTPPRSSGGDWLRWGCATALVMVVLYLVVIWFLLSSAGPGAALVVGLSMVVLYAVRLSRQAGTLARRLERPTTTVANLRAGEVEVAGTLEVSEPVTGLDGEPLALVHVQVRSRWRPTGPKAAPRIEVKQDLRLGSGLSVRDATGVCALGEGAIRLLAEPRQTPLSPVTLDERASAYAALAVEGAHSFEVIERFVRPSGRAIVVGAVGHAEDEKAGYRSAEGARPLLVPSPSGELTIVAGLESELRAQLRRQRLGLGLVVAVAGVMTGLGLMTLRG